MDISNWHGVPFPPHVAIEGYYARLEPLNPAKHGDELFDAVTGEEAERLHRYLADPIPTSRADFESWLVPRAASRDPQFYAVIDRRTGRVEGRQSFMDINTANGSAEIGYILWGPRIARSRITTEAFFLLADLAFSLGYRRWQWRCNANNTPSRKAAERFGYQFEGIFRNHMVVKGVNRDTAWYSITDEEWKTLRLAYEAWLAPSNFDPEGQQKQKLELRPA